MASVDTVVRIPEDLANPCCAAWGVNQSASRPCHYYRSLLSPDECLAVLSVIGKKHQKEGNDSVEPGVRSQFPEFDSALSETIWARIAANIPPELDGGRAVGLETRWRHARYYDGQSVFAHMDFRHRSQEPSHAAEVRDVIVSRMSLTVYLDDAYTGGEIVFVR